MAQRGGELEVFEHLGHAVADGVGQVGMAQASHLDGAHAGYGDTAGAVHHQAQVGIHRAPKGEGHFITGFDDVVGGDGWQRVLA